jgi:hypothetical protein
MQAQKFHINWMMLIKLSSTLWVGFFREYISLFPTDAHLGGNVEALFG